MSKFEQWQIRKPAAVGEGGVVAAQHWRAAEAGVEILKQGGNAVDAAVAAAFALGVVEPWMCGLGGSGYMLMYIAAEQRCRVINFQGTVAAAIDLADYPLAPLLPDSLMGFPGVADNRNVVGYGSISVPGAVAGLALALDSFGALSFERVITPAVDLAARGLPLDWHATLNIALEMHDLLKDPGAAAVYLPRGCPPRPEGWLPLGNLGQTLRALAEYGPSEFYTGETAQRLVEDLNWGGSAISLQDLADYRAEIREPLSALHRGARVYGADQTSGARRLLDTLAYVEVNLQPGAAVGSDTYLCYARGLNAAFVAHKQRTGLIDKAAGCTSHLSAVDRAGNMVALTYTLLNRFGSHVVLPQTGVLMNNAISYFDPRPDRPTSLVGGKRINSSNMCPTIATRDGSAWFSVGASGANYIVPAVAQIVALLLDYGMSLEEAFHTPRIDASARDGIRVDAALPPDIIDALAAYFQLEIAQRMVFPKLYACPSGVLHDPQTGLNYGMADPSSPIAAAQAEGAVRTPAQNAVRAGIKVAEWDRRRRAGR